jgi:hypothetical protein
VPRIAVSLSGKEQYIEQTQIKQKPINLQCVSPLDIHIAVSRLLLLSTERESPRDKPGHPVFIAETIGVATNASLHGTRPWHLRLFV